MHDPLNVYRGRYKEFIESIILGTIDNCIDGYHENHHIVPRCTFEDQYNSIIDSEDNQCLLSARNHFIAHRILAEENPTIPGLVYAYWMMCNCRDVCTPEEYEEAKKLYIVHFTKEHPDFSGEKNPFYGRSHSEYSINKIRKAREQQRGENSPMYGKHHSAETRELISISLSGENSSVINKKSMHKGSHMIFVDVENIEKYLSLGYVLGKKVIEYTLTCKKCGTRFSSDNLSRRYCDICKT